METSQCTAGKLYPHFFDDPVTLEGCLYRITTQILQGSLLNVGWGCEAVWMSFLPQALASDGMASSDAFSRQAVS